jgi:hypothetical protein
MKDFFSEGLAAEKGLTELDFDPDLIVQGMRVEMEHTKDPKVARKIAIDHLAEDIRYYDYLEKMERDMHNEKPLRNPKNSNEAMTEIIREINSQFIVFLDIEKMYKATWGYPFIRGDGNFFHMLFGYGIGYAAAFREQGIITKKQFDAIQTWVSDKAEHYAEKHSEL